MSYTDLMQTYLRGEADKQQKDMLSDWISESEENYQIFLRVKNIWEAEHPAFSEEEVEGIKNKEKLVILKEKKMFSQSFMRWWSIASAILIIPLTGLCLALLSSKNKERESVINQSISCAYGATSKFMLPDGSIVYLNSGSTINFPSKFNMDERVVDLRGEAFFEVLSDKEHPFCVRTEGMEIIATGTKFNVEAYQGFSSRVTLVSGHLDIKKGISNYSLAQGHQLECSPNGIVSSFRTDTFKWTSWKDGIIAFRGDKLSYVFERLSLIYHAKIIIEDPAIGEYQIRATFIDERLDEIMSLLEKCAPIKCERQKGKYAEEETEYHLYLTNN